MKTKSCLFKQKTNELSLHNLRTYANFAYEKVKKIGMEKKHFLTVISFF